MLFVRALVARPLFGRRTGERRRPFALFPLTDAANSLHEIRVVDRLLSVPRDVAIHRRERSVTFNGRSISLDVERKHREQRGRYRHGAEPDRALVDSPFVAT